MVRLEDILFWVFIAIIIGTALWLLSGSPPEISAIISIGLAVAGSELMIWKKLFSIDKNTLIGFMKVKYSLEKVNDKLNSIGKWVKK